jgi:bifunctional non-homologous end joining protein LigD
MSLMTAARPTPSPIPYRISTQQPILVTETLAGEKWLHEVKHDGFRMLARLNAGEAAVTSRHGRPWGSRLPHLAAAVAKLPCKSVILDGELCCPDPEGRSDFDGLRSSFGRERTDHLVYMAFDLIYLDGHDWRPVPLDERKATLVQLLAGENGQGPILFTDHVVGGGPIFLEAVRLHGLEGVVSKRRSSRYRGGRRHGPG